MSATGADTNASTTSSFVAALVVAGITVGVFTAIWLIMRNRAGLRKVFQPRVELAPESKRPEPLPKGLVPFWKAVFKTPDASIIAANGPDAYFFVRFIKVFGLYMLVPYFFLSFAICIPIS
jgi:MFS superfamily sulfate permease-like transporter